jgi:putative ABC transport system substrate-binding protein
MLGIQLKYLNVHTPEDVEPALAEALALQTQASMLGATGFTDPTPRVVEFQVQKQIPVAFFSKESVRAGGLLSYGPSLNGLGRETATLVGKLLNGARPADLPVEQPTEYELVINQTTAQALGIPIPPEVAQQVTEWVQ